MCFSSLFFLFLFCFSAVFIFFEFFRQNIFFKKKPFLENNCFQKNIFLNLFFWGGKNVEQFFVQKLSFEISSKKKKERTFFQKQKNSFLIHMRRGVHTRLKALFTIAASRDVVERVKSHVHSVVIDSRPRDIRCIKPSLSLSFFSCSVFFWIYNPSVFLTIFLISLLHCSSIFSCMTENHFFTLFVSLFLLSCFLSFCAPLCLAKEIWWQRTRHVTKRNEWKQWWEWSPRSEKGGLSCWRVFEHDWRCELLDQNQPRRVRRQIMFGKTWQQ